MKVWHLPPLTRGCLKFDYISMFWCEKVFAPDARQPRSVLRDLVERNWSNCWHVKRLGSFGTTIALDGVGAADQLAAAQATMPGP